MGLTKENKELFISLVKILVNICYNISISFHRRGQMERLKKQMEFILEVDKLKKVTRQSYISDGSRFENDTEHSWSLALMCMLLCEYSNRDIDVLRTMSMVIIHDIVELDAGDTYAYDEAGNLSKRDREVAAAERIFHILPLDQATYMRGLWEEFEAGRTPEAKFASTLDRVQPILLNDITGGKAWKNHGVKASQVYKRNEATKEGSQEIWEFARELLEKNIEKENIIEDRGMTMDNKEIRERYELAMERVEGILTEETVKAPYNEYFQSMSGFILEIKSLLSSIEEGQLNSMSLEALQQLNASLYKDIVGGNYETSFANPRFAAEKCGEKYGKIMAFLAAEIRGMIVYAYENRLFDITINLELFIEVYNYFEGENEHTYKDVKNAIYYFISDYSEITVVDRIRESLDTTLDFAVDIIRNSDLEDLRYLYKFGEYISENELAVAKYLNALPQEKIDAMASTYTEGFRKGFIQQRMDLGKKALVNIRYAVGFERIIRKAIENFKEMGLEPIIFRAAIASINKNPNGKAGYFSTSPNRQYEYDHRFDSGIYMDKAFIEKKLIHFRQGYERYKDLADKMAGPAVLGVFGEIPFQPENKKENCKLDEKQQKLQVNYQRDIGLISNEYIKQEETSFTIIAYPIPEIGEEFQEIFDETVKVNTLDDKLYQEIQQAMIDVLDQGDYVQILGSGENKTNLKVKLAELSDKNKETLFENCLADVNIPVGEVFTSPKLEGTNGILHVSQVYLGMLKYMDLTLTFEDGTIKDYTCKNFKEESANKEFLKENLLCGHETLPMGEFAIGTNTAAYVMAKKYNISDKLPILIAEKTGPHFAVGDTCYSMSEDNRVYNPDGKEIIAKENSISILRKSDIEKAYFSCHTDITIPYDELGEISVYTKEGEKTTIIKNGKFVLKGTEKLNEALEG